MSFGGKTPAAEIRDFGIVDDNTIIRDSTGRLENFLRCPADKSDYLAAVQSLRSHAKIIDVAQEREVVRRYRQISVSVLGFNDMVYPCLSGDGEDVAAFDEGVMDLELPKVHNVDGDDDDDDDDDDEDDDDDDDDDDDEDIELSTPSFRVKLGTFKQNTLKSASSELFNAFELLLHTPTKPAQFQKSAHAKVMMKIMCQPEYLESTRSITRTLRESYAKKSKIDWQNHVNELSWEKWI